jgi:microcystin-dependent protein
MAYFPSLQVPAGVIFDYGGLTAPTGWLMCYGATKNVSDYPALASVIRPALPAMVSVSSSVITFAGDHNLVANEPVVFLGGTAPAGLTAGAVYFVRSSGLTSTAFSVSGSRGGTIVSVTTIGSGSTAYASPFEVTNGHRVLLPSMSSVASNTITFASAHQLTANDPVIFLNGTAPAGLTSGTTYYVISSGLTATAFKVSTSIGGSAAAVTSIGSGSSAYHAPYESGTGVSSSTFKLPDCRGVAAFGKQETGSRIDSTESSVNYPGTVGYIPYDGLSAHTLTSSESGVADHQHTDTLTFNLSTGIGSNGAYAGGPGQTSSAFQQGINGSVTGVVGGGQAASSSHNNMPPAIIVNKIISTGGQ